MTRQIAVVCLSLASVLAHAAGSYTLTVVNAYNPFSPSGTSVILGPVPTGGAATVDAVGNVAATGVQFSFVNVSSAHNYTNGVWSAVVGGSSVTHTETCTETAGQPCTGSLSGFTGLWNNTQQNGGAPTSACAASGFFAAGNCDRLSIVEVPGVSLTIIEQSEFAIPALPSGWIYRFGAVCASFPVQLVQNSSTNTIVTPARCAGFPGAVTLSVPAPPANGTASVSGVNIVYTPNSGFVGVDTLIYQGSDGSVTTQGAVTITVRVDTDGDGVWDSGDNCTLVVNPNQLDADADGYGNICDADLNNSGLVTSADYAILRAVLGQAATVSATAAAADLNGSGAVTTADFELLRARLGTAPGPHWSLP